MINVMIVSLIASVLFVLFLFWFSYELLQNFRTVSTSNRPLFSVLRMLWWLQLPRSDRTGLCSLWDGRWVEPRFVCGPQGCDVRDKSQVVAGCSWPVSSLGTISKITKQTKLFQTREVAGTHSSAAWLPAGPTTTPLGSAARIPLPTGWEP